MMFDNLPELRTGSSMKQKEHVEDSMMRNVEEEFHPVTTTEVNDIFDDEIWNHSVELAQHDLQNDINNNNHNVS